MSGIINLLPDALANQIAAGEVIQRPASVVKEMLENALDAKSTQIKLIIKDSGKTLIQVVDNGIGMTETDARLCFERHATSKIQSSDDLFQIRSFGFRGEAMASIAAIAHVELKTKRAEDELGTYVSIEGSKVKKQEPQQLPNGTSITVRNLFYNVPARRKFLKSDPVELKHILEEFTRIALPNPDIFFSVYHNDNELYHFTSSNLRQRIASYFGKNTNENIVPVQEETDFISISGFIGKPELIKKSRGDQYLFVNTRFIKSNYLNHAIKIAYESLIPKDHFPFYVLLLDIDPAMIDVNIHPTKQEVKFENERLIYNYVKVAVKHALGKYSITPSLDFDVENNQPFTAPSTLRQDNFSQDRVGTTVTTSPRSKPAAGKQEKEKWLEFYENIANQAPQEQSGAITLSSNWSEDEEEATDSQKCFQVHDSYIISPIKSGWMVIDQSAAHERILYERHLKALEKRQSLSQTSLFPETIQVSAANTPILESLLEQLQYVGFQIEKFGQNTFVVNALPVDGLDVPSDKFINNFVEAYTANQELELKLDENIARSMAGQMKIAKGKSLTDVEMQALIDKLFACQMPYASPSGKKCIITFGLDEVEHRFRN